MIYFLPGFALILGLAIWMLLPLFAPASATPVFGGRSVDDLIEAKQAVYRRILDLEMDQKTGKLSAADYLAEKAEAELEAAEILGELDHDFATDVLELEIAAAREHLERKN